MLVFLKEVEPTKGVVNMSVDLMWYGSKDILMKQMYQREIEIVKYFKNNLAYILKYKFEFFFEEHQT